MSSITDEKVRSFLLREARTGKIAYTAKDGRPLVAPVWFTVEGDRVLFNTERTSAKGMAIARDPRLAVCVDEESGHTFVQIQGTAETTENHEEVLRVATTIATRYVGEEKATKLGERIAGPGQLAVYLRPSKVIASGDLTR